MTTDLPYEGEWSFASKRKFDATVIFVHHFGGSKRSLLRHARLLNELGFDCVRFNLKYNMTQAPKSLSLLGDFKLGLRRIWADQIQDILNLVPGPKILFSFSMPGAAAVEAIARRNAHQIMGFICDSGPFLQITEATWKLYKFAYKIENPLLRAFYTALSFSMWGINFKSEIKSYFKSFPKQFRILSIRSGADRLVALSAIDAFFALANNCNIEVLNIANADHLEGLKNYSQVYVSNLNVFLESLFLKA